MEKLEAYNKVNTEIETISSNRDVTLVAVSKTYKPEDIETIYEIGHRHFGENRVQELTEKYEELPKDILWHQIGHLQTNKVKYIVPFIHLIHSADSKKVLKEINKQGKKINRVINCLLQFHIAKEESKYGLSLAEAKEILSGEFFKGAEHINICGVMGMATYTEDEEMIKNEFQKLKNIFDELKGEFFEKKHDFKEISMGMSGDYQLAIREGSTMVRVGSAIFGKRE